MKIYYLLFLLLAASAGFSQKEYHCVYRDSVFFTLADSSLESMREKLSSQGLPDETVDEAIQKIAGQKYITMERKVAVSETGSVIVFDKKNSEGTLNTEGWPDSFMYKNGEIYLANRGEEKGFSIEPSSASKRIFQPTGSERTILNYLCSEYFSTDSTCRVWITTSLPSSINPGIRTGSLPGAVLAFELAFGNFITKSQLTELRE